MNYELRVVLACLTVYRLSQLFVLDDGPYDMFKQIRSFLGRRANTNSTWKTLADLFNCPFCLGVWFAGLAVPTVIYPTLYADIVLLWLGISGLQAFLEGFTNVRTN